jgi:hypothetical protein
MLGWKHTEAEGNTSMLMFQKLWNKEHETMPDTDDSTDDQDIIDENTKETIAYVLSNEEDLISLEEDLDTEDKKLGGKNNK